MSGVRRGRALLASTESRWLVQRSVLAYPVPFASRGLGHILWTVQLGFPRHTVP